MQSPKHPATDSGSPKLKRLGWREWVSLPDLGVAWIKAKLDTGARTSSLHVENLELFEREGKPWARFTVLPRQRRAKPGVQCEARVREESRSVRSSTGHEHARPVIITTLEMGGARLPIELTLADRSKMRFRLLLGRQALRGQWTVDAGHSFRLGRLRDLRDGP